MCVKKINNMGKDAVQNETKYLDTKLYVILNKYHLTQKGKLNVINYLNFKISNN